MGGERRGGVERGREGWGMGGERRGEEGRGGKERRGEREGRGGRGGGEGRGGRESFTRNKGPINLMESVIGAGEGEGIPQDNRSHCGSEHTRRRATTWRETEINHEFMIISH